MNKQDFYFNLPESLIAQYPLASRSSSRLLVYNRQTKEYRHQKFHELLSFLEEGDLLVMNNSKVIPARLYGQKASGGKIELLVERLCADNTLMAHIKASKGPKAGCILILEKQWQVQVIHKIEDFYYCKVLGNRDVMLEEIGHIPLPPYIERSPETSDLNRYQTVYAEHNGSVAAPTAGLHFDEALISQLQQKGVQIAYSTLHVGAGTFRPVRSERITDHKMHSEEFEINEDLCQAVNKARSAGKRVIAVGTTSLRSLESASLDDGTLMPCKKETNIFIYPGYRFKVCDGLITNFHLPESTLLMLVSAFIGHKEAMDLYQEAISNGYRFFSYGDASLLL